MTAPPLWSPNGRRILFRRQARSGAMALCLTGANGGPVTRLAMCGARDSLNAHWSPNGRTVALQRPGGVAVRDLQTRRARRWPGADDFYWSPNGRHGYVCYDKGPDRIVDMVTGQTRPVRITTYGFPFEGGQKMVWLDDRTLVGIGSNPDDKRVTLTTLGADGERKRQILCRWPKGGDDPYRESINAGARQLLPLPRSRQTVIYMQDVGDSGTRPCYAFWRADAYTGRMQEITGGQCLAWAGDGAHFCTAAPRYTRPYGPLLNGYQKQLYVAELWVGSLKTGMKQNITPGMVWVTGADWRPRGVR